MPSMSDDRFARSVVLVATHSADGAMGFMLNRKVASPTFLDILDELDLVMEAARQRRQEQQVAVFSGGPVEQGRGFVIHSLDYGSPGTSRIKDLAGVTATLDVLRALSGPHPPRKSVMLLGYAGWSAGQLEQEIAANGWLTVPATEALLFDTPWKDLYEAGLAALGISEALLSSEAGRA
ncbi:YqgE/AlgH family protein [Rhizobiaceae bacterium]|nr:YqgE/AlgH family protein [Rhizobiaceae bacterium]